MNYHLPRNGSTLRVGVVFQYGKDTRYSVNALVASLDKLSQVYVILAESEEELLNTAKTITKRGDLCVAAFSLLTTMLPVGDYYVKLRELVKLLRDIKCITIAGGPHVSGDPLGALRYFGFNYVFIGEAEASLRNFIQALRDGLDLLNIRGIAYLDEGNNLVFTGREKPINLDEYDPFPYWRGIVNPIEITRGCPYGCYYCQVSYLHGKHYRHRSVEKVVYYVGKVLELGIRDIRFISPDSLAYGLEVESRDVDLASIENLVLSVYNVARSSGGRIYLGSFPSEARPEHVSREVVNLLKKYVANKSLIIGAQSGSERILRSIGRKHSVEDVVEAADVAVKHGFTPEIDLIFGFPGESLEDMNATIRLAWRLIKIGARIHLHHYIPLPGTPFGMKKPTPIPLEVKKEIWRIIGAGKGYGDWLKQEEISWKIVDLHEKGVIQPKQSKAPGFIT